MDYNYNCSSQQMQVEELNCLPSAIMKGVAIVLWIRLFMSPIIVFGNVSTIIVIIKYERMHTFANALVLSLAFTDCIVGSVFLPFNSFYLFTGKDLYSYKFYSLFQQGPYYYTLYLQMMNQVLIALDRFLAIVYPFKYPLIVTRNSITVVLCLMWTLPLPGPVCFMTFWNT